MKTCLPSFGRRARVVATLVATCVTLITGPVAAQPGVPARAQPSTTAAEPAPAEDRADLDRTRILGQRELPKVLTIVPWKKPLAAPGTPRPPISVLDEALTPVDRDVLKRELGYHAQLRARALAGAASPATER